MNTKKEQENAAAFKAAIERLNRHANKMVELRKERWPEPPHYTESFRPRHRPSVRITIELDGGGDYGVPYKGVC